LEGKVEVFEAGADGWRTLFLDGYKRDDSYLAEWRCFLACISDGSPPAVSGDDGLEVLRVVEAARQSSRLGAVVRMEHDCGGRASPAASA
jgi:predicted dehydrogenase